MATIEATAQDNIQENDSASDTAVYTQPEEQPETQPEDHSQTEDQPEDRAEALLETENNIETVTSTIRPDAHAEDEDDTHIEGHPPPRDMWRTVLVDEHYSTVHGSPTLTLKCGEQTGSLVVVLIPGCPGVGTLYKDFIRHLHLLSRLPIWCICHAGHVVMPPDVNKPTCPPDLYTLEGQTMHKYLYLKDHIEAHMKVVLIGHQIGAHMVLELLKMLPSDQVLRAMLLFPIIERTADTPGAMGLAPLLNYGQWAVTGFMSLLSYGRERMHNYFIDWYYDGIRVAPCVRRGMQRLIDGAIFRNIFKLLEDQMNKVQEADFDNIEQNSGKICFFYGSRDDWVPVSYCQEMTESYPAITLMLDPDGIPADFYIKTKASKYMAEQIWQWISVAY